MVLKIEMHKERGKYGIYKSRGVSKCLLSVLTNVPTIYIFRQILNTERGGGKGKYGKDDNLLSFFVHLFVYNLVHVDKVSLSDKIAPEKNNLQQNICRF